MTQAVAAWLCSNLVQGSEEKAENIDSDILASLGTLTPVKRWLAASLDKTIRLYMGVSSGFWLMTFS